MPQHLNSPEHYKQRADECLASAERSRNLRERADMLFLAAHWERLAEYSKLVSVDRGVLPRSLV